VGVVPAETALTVEHAMASSALYAVMQRLLHCDDGLRYLNVYEPSSAGTMRGIIRSLPSKEAVFLYSFLRCGVGLVPAVFGRRVIADALHVHDAYFGFLDDHFRSQSVYGNAGLRDIECKRDQTCFKEFIFRNNHRHQDWTNCTLDLSLKMGGITCPELEGVLFESAPIRALQRLYHAVFPSKRLRLVNVGFFQSPATNPGQNWHTDYEFTAIDGRYTTLSPLVTVLVALSRQQMQQLDGGRVGTNGSTVFCLGSNQSPSSIMRLCKEFPAECEQWMYRVVQPVLEQGDVVCFQGHVMHFGGAYNFVDRIKEEHPDRVVLYGVMHLLPSNAAEDEYLETDMNIFDGKELQSLFGGGRFKVVRKEKGPEDQEEEEEEDGDESEDEEAKRKRNPFEVKKHRWRDRSGNS